MAFMAFQDNKQLGFHVDLPSPNSVTAQIDTLLGLFSLRYETRQLEDH